MRIHTSLTHKDIINAIDKTRRLSPYGVVYAHKLTEHGSRTHERAFEVQLTGNARHRINNQRYDAPRAAHWDEWGVFLAIVFDADPDARAGSAKYPAYTDEGDFHYKTGNRFDHRTGIDGEPCVQHRWEYGGGTAACNKGCGATMRH